MTDWNPEATTDAPGAAAHEANGAESRNGAPLTVPRGKSSLPLGPDAAHADDLTALAEDTEDEDSAPLPAQAGLGEVEVEAQTPTSTSLAPSSAEAGSHTGTFETDLQEIAAPAESDMAQAQDDLATAEDEMVEDAATAQDVVAAEDATFAPAYDYEDYEHDEGAPLENEPEVEPSPDGQWGGEPPNNYYPYDTSHYEPPDPNAPAHDKEQDLFEHLGELRQRLLRCIFYLVPAMALTWHFTPEVQALLVRPIKLSLDRYAPGSTLQLLDPTDAFMIYFQTSLIAAIIIVMPLLLIEMWGFLEPALTHKERRYTSILVPFSVLLFFLGTALGYVVSPLFFQFFLQFTPPETLSNYAYAPSVVLLAKMLLVFGVCFQVPVVTVFVNKIGLVSRNWLIEYWRHAVVVIFTVVAVITPTWDPITLTICALPPCILYVFSIWLVKWL